jgi:hypothetical protein
MNYTDRSRILSYQRCPRSRFWEYHYRGCGIVPDKPSEHLAIGSMLHEGLERLILGQSLTDVLEDLRPLQMDWPETWTEARWQIDALLTAFSLAGLEKLNSAYEILETEREDQLPLTPLLTLMTRTDALVEDRSSGDLYIASYKSAGSYDQRKEEYHRHDLQGITEPLSVQHRLGRQVEGVQMVYLIKGIRKKSVDLETGEETKRFGSALLYGYNLEGTDEWAHSYEWTCESPHDVSRGKGCSGGTAHRLGKGWKKLPVATCYPGGVVGWVNSIHDGQIQSNARETEQFLDRYIVIPPPICRDQEEMKERIEEITFQEDMLDTICRENLMTKELAAKVFPRYEHSCTYPSICKFHSLCWGSTKETDPLNCGFRLRTPNHPSERIEIVEDVPW